MMTAPMHPRDTTLGGPPVRVPAPVDDVRGSVVGRRCILAAAEGYLYDLVAVTDPYVDPGLGDRVILLALEDNWWDWVHASRQGRDVGPRPRDCKTFDSWRVYVEGAALL